MNKNILTGFGFFSGMMYPLIALKILWQNKHLWQYLLIPIMINFIVGIVTYILLLEPSLTLFDNITNNLVFYVDKLIDNLPEWSVFLIYIILTISFILKIILIGLILIIIGFIITQFGSIIGSPWYGKLSEKLEILRSGKLEIIELNIFHDLWRAILFELKKLVLISLISIPLLIINLIPAIGNTIFIVGGITLTMMIICLDFCDAILERKRLKFRQKLNFIIQKMPTTIGFSLFCLFLISIPFVNLIVIPLCVSAGTLLVCDLSSN